MSTGYFALCALVLVAFAGTYEAAINGAAVWIAWVSAGAFWLCVIIAAAFAAARFIRVGKGNKKPA